jgi:hypothetical protein
MKGWLVNLWRSCDGAAGCLDVKTEERPSIEAPSEP